MKVAINGLLLGKTDSGVHRCIRGLARGLDELEATDEFVLFTGHGYDPKGWEPQRVGIHRAKVPSQIRSARIAYDQALFPLAARLKGADLLHGPGYIVPCFTRMPTVVTVYDIIALKHPDLCKRTNAAYYKWALPRSVQRALKVIVPSGAVKNDLCRLLKVPAAKIAVVPPGVDEVFGIAREDAKAKARETYQLPRKFVLFVGNIEPKKNLEGLIKSFFAAKLDQELPHKLVVAGQKGWKCQEVMRLVKELDFEEHIIFPGYVPLEDLPAVYSLADCFAFPSLVEGFGIPPLEAMACGAPVVTSEDPALVETTGDAALRVPATDIEALRKALTSVLTDRPVRRRLREAGLKRAAEFTWRRNAEMTLDVYREALGAAGGQGDREPGEQRAE